MPAQPPFAVSPNYNTQLNPLQEMQFRQWVQSNNVPFDPNADGSDYDMRGYWQGLQNGNPMAAPTQINPNDNLPHYTDYYKTPSHQTFSAGSQWGDQNTPDWINGSQLASPNGQIVYDENKPNQAIINQLLGSK